MKKNFSLAIILLSMTVHAASQSQLEAVSEMGKLNGIALQCHYLEQVSHIKMTLINNLPKQRGLGEHFEKSTSQSFLALIENDSRCPGPAQFDEQIKKAISNL